MNIGTRRARAIAAETVASTLAARTPTLVTFLVVAAVTMTGMFTAGRSAAAERTLAERVDAAGARIITVSDGTGNAGLNDTALARAANLTGLDWTIGLGLITNIWPSSTGPEGTPIAGRSVVGTQPTAIKVLTGRWPLPGEAVATTTGLKNLGLAAGAGTITDGVTTHPIVGVIQVITPALDLSADVLFRVDISNAPLPQIVAMAHDIDQVPALSGALSEVAGVEQPGSLRVTSSNDLLALRRLLGSDFSGYSRTIAALVMLAGMILIALTMHGAMTARRRDFGRRRALGASRSTLVSMILGQTILPAALGATLGGGSGLLLVKATTSSTVPALYTLALATLGLLAAMLAAIPVGIATARRDPVRELRVP